MKPPVAGALAAALVAGLAVLGFSLLPQLWVWAAFIGWASYDLSGANRKALITSSASMVFGVVMAWIVALTIDLNLLPLDAPLASALAAALASFLIVLAARIPALSNVPATFFGFASAFAYLFMSKGAMTAAVLTEPTFENVLFCISVSVLIGSGLGVAHQVIARTITPKRHRVPEPSALRPGRSL